MFYFSRDQLFYRFNPLLAISLDSILMLVATKFIVDVNLQHQKSQRIRGQLQSFMSDFLCCFAMRAKLFMIPNWIGVAAAS
jgi:hypothetical protein